MPKKVTGFLTRDQQFYTTDAEACRHEAEMEIRALCAELKPKAIDPEKFITALEAMADQVLEYLHASNEIEIPNTIPHKHHSDDGLTTHSAEALQSLTSDGREPMPYMGSRTSPKTIQD